MSSSNDSSSRANDHHPNDNNNDIHNNNNTHDNSLDGTDSSISLRSFNEPSSIANPQQQQHHHQTFVPTPSSQPPSYTPGFAAEVNSNHNAAFPIPASSSYVSSIDTTPQPEESRRRKRGYSLRTQLFSKNINNQNEPPSPIELQQQTFSPPSSFGPHNSGITLSPAVPCLILFIY
jgi:hypothetical protein